MRASVVVLIAGLAGCDLVFTPGAGFDPGVVDADPDQRFDAGLDGGGGGESDADRSLDADLAHNEDGDALRDVEDPCPHIAGPAVDTDTDGVGDACDPEPDNPRQKIEYFNGFGAGLDGLVGFGDTEFDVDDVRLRGIAADTATLYLPGTRKIVDVYTHVIVEDVAVSLIADVMPIAGHAGVATTIHGTSCRLGRTGSSTDVFWELHHQPGPAMDITVTPTSNTGPLLGMSADLHLHADSVAHHAECDGVGAHLNGDPQVLDGEVGLAARRVDVRFSYLLVISTDDVD